MLQLSLRLLLPHLFLVLLLLRLPLLLLLVLLRALFWLLLRCSFAPAAQYSSISSSTLSSSRILSRNMSLLTSSRKSLCVRDCLLLPLLLLLLLLLVLQFVSKHWHL